MEHFLIALPTALAGTTIHGSTRGACCVCAVEVWVAPSSLAILAAQPERRLICIECVRGHPGIVLPTTVAQRAEIAAHRGRN